MRYVEKNGLWVPQYTVGSGLGTWVARHLYNLGIKQTPGCGCPKTQRFLNSLTGRPRGVMSPISGGMAAPDGQEDICTRPDVFFCENWEVGRDTNCLTNTNCPPKYKNSGRYDKGFGAGNKLITAGVGFNNTKGYEEVYGTCDGAHPNPVTGACDPGGYIDFFDPVNGYGFKRRTVFVRAYFKYTAGTFCNPTCPWTRSKFFEFSPDDGGTSTHLFHINGREDFPNPRPLESTTQGDHSKNYTSNVQILTDVWYCAETQITINTGPNTPDGILRLWVNDQLVVDSPNIVVSSGTGPFQGTTLYRITTSGSGNWPGPTPPETGPPPTVTGPFRRYVDRIVLATQPNANPLLPSIGCSGDTPPPVVSGQPKVVGGGFGFAGQIISGGR